MNQYLLPILSIAIPTIVVIGVAIYQNKIKKLSYEIVLNTPLVKVSSKVKDKIEVYYEKNKVENPQILIIRFLNNGNQPISTSDFEESIKLVFHSDAKIIQCESTNLNPDSLSLNFNHAKNTITIDPLLLNSNEGFTLNLIIEGEDSSFTIIDRIQGVNVKKYKEPFFIVNDWIYLPIAFFASFVWMYYFTPMFQRSYTAEYTLLKLANVPMYAFPTGILFISIISIPNIYRFFRKRRLEDK